MKKTKIINLNKYKKAKKFINKKNKGTVQSNLTVEDNMVINELKQEFKFLMQKGGK